MGWDEEWAAAIEELDQAEARHRNADAALASARSRMQRAQDVCARLFRQRINEVERELGL
jgi:hypothetical protein